MFGRRYQEIWKKKCLTFRFVIWKYPAFIFSSCRIWSEFMTGTMTGAKCYLTKLSHPWQAISIFLIIPSSLISLSLIRTAAGCDLKFFSYIAFVCLNLKFLKQTLKSRNWSIYGYEFPKCIGSLIHTLK